MKPTNNSDEVIRTMTKVGIRTQNIKKQILCKEGEGKEVRENFRVGVK